MRLKQGVDLMKLADYIYFKRIKLKDLARELEITPVYLRFIKNGRYKPSKKLALKIEIFTGGAVKMHELRGEEVDGE
jgi:DNA-binding transcriptional regulator YdaS (Cro superfamily)